MLQIYLNGAAPCSKYENGASEDRLSASHQLCQLINKISTVCDCSRDGRIAWRCAHSSLNLDPDINCHIMVSDAERGINVCAVHRMDTKPEDLSASTGCSKS